MGDLIIAESILVVVMSFITALVMQRQFLEKKRKQLAMRGIPFPEIPWQKHAQALAVVTAINIPIWGFFVFLVVLPFHP